MILQSLVEYYEVLAAAGQLPQMGFATARVAYELRLSPAGELMGVIPLRETVTRGKKTVEIPRMMEVPEPEVRAVGIKANFLCDNSGYLLGVDAKGKPVRTKQCYEASAALHHAVLDGVDDPAAQALLAHFDTWRPEDAAACAALQPYWDDLLAGSNLVFSVEGYGYVHERETIRRAWRAYCQQRATAPVMPCLVTGHHEPVAILHARIKGVKGAQATGAAIVSFNARAYESYGREEAQGLNAPVSEYAAFAYTTALNYLLADTAHRQVLGDTTIVYWALSEQPIYRDLYGFSLSPTDASDDEADPAAEVTVDKAAEERLRALFQKIVNGEPIAAGADTFDPNTRFCVLGLAPNASRLSVRFYEENRFGTIMENLAAHYRDLEIVRAPWEPRYIPLWQLLLETVPPQSKEKASSPLLSGSVLRAILKRLPYPQALQENVHLRIRAEGDVTRGKAAILKACSIRSHPDKKEEMTVSLNEQSTNRAYLLGRLFAALEKAQQDANPGINTTIKDRFLSSACATPAVIFPQLLRLSVHHIAKADYGFVDDRRISEIMDKLNIDGEPGSEPFPKRLTLEEQSLFYLGYYHQMKANFTKTKKEDDDHEPSDSKSV